MFFIIISGIIYAESVFFIKEVKREFAILGGQPFHFEGYRFVKKIILPGNRMTIQVGENKEAKRMAVFLNGNIQEEFEQLGDDFYFSEDGNWLAYGGIRDGKTDIKINHFIFDKDQNGFTNDSHLLMIRDGKFSGRFKFSRDGKHFAYLLLTEDKKHVLFMDNQPLNQCDWIGDEFKFTPDGENIVYSCRQNDTFYLIKNQELLLSKTSYLTHLHFSPDGKRIAYIQKKSKDSRPFFVIDGIASNDHILTGKINQDICFFFSPDSRKVAYIASNKDNKYFVVINSKEENKYDEISFIDGVIFSSDSRDYAYIAKDKGKSFIVYNGNITKQYDERYQPTCLKFSPDGKHLAYVVNAKDKSGDFVVVDGVESEKYPRVRQVFFSPDSKNIIYPIYRKDYTTMVVNGQEGKKMNFINYYDFARKGDLAFQDDNTFTYFAVPDVNINEEIVIREKIINN